MKTRKILFYGDSNTYGYDPADWQTFRYPPEQRWTSILADLLGESWMVIPEGMNGRQLPELPFDRKWLTPLLDRLDAGDVFAVMLGTNDLLVTLDPRAEEAIQKMRAFLLFLKEYAAGREILVTAPPHIGRADVRDPLLKRYFEESLRMNEGFRQLAAESGVHFADAAGWGIELTGDRVHFSESGHRRYAEKMAEVIREVWK